MVKKLRKICCIGEVMIELSQNGEDSMSVGVAGDTYNTAVYLNRAIQSTGATTTYLTALGDDPYSGRIQAALKAHGLDTSKVEIRSGAMPGLYAIDLDAQGERSFSYWRSAAAVRSLFVAPCEVVLESLYDFDLVYLSGISLAVMQPDIRERLISFLQMYREAGGLVAYDSNYRPSLWESQERAQEINARMWRLTSIALPSIDDEMALFGDRTEQEVLNRFAEYGTPFGALKRGGAGPRDLVDHRVPTGLAEVTEVVDSTAAGDSFNAGYLGAIVRGDGAVEAMRAGHLLASKVIAHRGAIISSDKH